MSTCRIPENVSFQALDGEVVLLSLDGGGCHGLDEPGTRIRPLIDAKLEPDQVVEKIAGAYVVEPGQARRDFDKFIQDLQRSGLIPT